MHHSISENSDTMDAQITDLTKTVYGLGLVAMFLVFTMFVCICPYLACLKYKERKERA